MVAVGVPDGGVVEVRDHNPVVCNAFFNVFDMRCEPWSGPTGDAALAAQHHPRFEQAVPESARRTPFVFDHFKPYYGLFFSLPVHGERILDPDVSGLAGLRHHAGESTPGS